MPSGRKPKQVDEEAIRNLFRAGVGIKPLERQFGIGAKRVRQIVGLASTPPAEKPTTEASEDDETPEAWELSINVPTTCLDASLRTANHDEMLVAVLELSAQDKASLFQTIFQNRLNALTTQEDSTDGATSSQ